ncbi:MAG: hemerythrin domain-containing protein, partial [Azonexus sp.]
MSAILVPTGLLTGVAEMDGQHDRLFHEIQQVKDALLAAGDAQGDGFALLSRLADELDQHFKWEEASARAHGIPFADHARDHARIGAFVRA